MSNRIAFEKYLTANGYKPDGEWHEDQQRYTRFSHVATWWALWNAGYQACQESRKSFGELHPANPDAKCKCEHWQSCSECHPTAHAAPTQEPVPPEIAKIISDNKWSLYEREAPTQEPDDAELLRFAIEEEFLLFCGEDEVLDIMRTTLQKYRTPPAAAQIALLEEHRQQYANKCLELIDAKEQIAKLEGQIAECAPYLKEGESVAACIKRNRDDSTAVLSLLHKEKLKTEALEAENEILKRPTFSRRELEDRIAKLEGDIVSLNKALTLCSEGNAKLEEYKADHSTRNFRVVELIETLTKLQAAARMALDALELNRMPLEDYFTQPRIVQMREAITALREALGVPKP